MSFVIRSRGFFFTDEYMSPIEGTFKPVKGARYDTRAEAEAALAVHNRKVLRTERLCDYVFDDRQGIGAVTAIGCLAITDPRQSREFFTDNRKRYHERHIFGVRARDIITEIEVPGIWVGHLVLENLDESDTPVGQERNAYQVVTLSNGMRRIAVSTPLDAYNPDAMDGES